MYLYINNADVKSLIPEKFKPCIKSGRLHVSYSIATLEISVTSVQGNLRIRIENVSVLGLDFFGLLKKKAISEVNNFVAKIPQVTVHDNDFVINTCGLITYVQLES